MFTKIKRLPSLVQGAIKASIFLLIVFIVWVVYSNRASKPNISYTIEYTVDKGMSFNSVLKDLEKSDIIRSYELAKLIQIVTGISLKQGVYKISPNMSTWQILDILNTGMAQLTTITFPEGFSARAVYNRLQSQGFENTKDFWDVIHNPEFLKQFNIMHDSAEGYLFPSTYKVPKTISGKEIASLMIKTFFNKTKKFTNGVTPEVIYQRVILASIIEKEAVTQKDRPIIASVFINRIRKKMRLESCATIIYIFESKGIKKNRVLFKDLDVESPYNTYRNPGLPVGPISNPGMNSLEAAFNPAETNYLFFVYKGNGEHFFTDNYQKHMDAYKKYIKYQYINKQGT